MKTRHILLFSFLTDLLWISCTSTARKAESSKAVITENVDNTSKEAENIVEEKIVNPTEVLLQKKEVPILCYHRIEDGRNDIYSVSPNIFASHLQVLADSGYNSILPNQLYDDLVHNANLPDKPFMQSLDDLTTEHYRLAASELGKRD